MQNFSLKSWPINFQSTPTSSSSAGPRSLREVYAGKLTDCDANKLRTSGAKSKRAIPEWQLVASLQCQVQRSFSKFEVRRAARVQRARQLLSNVTSLSDDTHQRFQFWFIDRPMKALPFPSTEQAMFDPGEHEVHRSVVVGQATRTRWLQHIGHHASGAHKSSI
jgi:hypothetical protein